MKQSFNRFFKALIPPLLALLPACATTPKAVPKTTSPAVVRYAYLLDLTDRSGDTFKVTLNVDRLSFRNDQFVLPAGGAYAMVDLDSLISNFQAYDVRGRISPSRRVAANRWQLLAPQEVARITYQIGDTWDLPEAQRFAEMLGTSLSDDFAYINGRGVFGALRGLEDAPLRLEIRLPENWRVGTALTADGRGGFFANTFSDLCTRPILAGFLSHEEIRLIGGTVRIFCYSRTDRIVAADLAPLVREVIDAMDRFMEGRIPLQTYSQLYVFDDIFAGGVQYLDNAAFVFAEDDLAKIRPVVRDVIAHEYFHRVIPFSIRSDAVNIEDLLAGGPTQHLWFFEGVTEWASDIVQLRSGLKNLEHFIVRDVRQKMIQEELFGKTLSLRDISMRSRGNPDQYANVYSRGALVALLLDIHLLELTDGRRGLREVLLDLLLDFGKERPLPEDRFFEILIDYCGPEFERFIRRYIIENAPLPYAEMFDKVGIDYIESRPASPPRADYGWWPGVLDGKLQILWLDEALKRSGLQKGDVIVALNGRRIMPENFEAALYENMLPRMDIGEPYDIEVLRNGRRLRLQGRVIPLQERHLFSLPRLLTPSQQRVRSVWLG